MAVDIDNLSDEDFDKLMTDSLESKDDGILEAENDEDVVVDPVDDEEDDTEVDDDEELDDEEVEEDLEQPEDEEGTEDSNDDDTDEEVIEEDDEDSSEADDEGDDQPEDDEDEKLETETDTVKESDEQVLKTYKVKANGTEFEFNEEELLKLAPKAMDYTRKMQEIAPWRKTISALKQEDISQEDLNLMIDVLKGDKDAMQSMLKRTGVDALDLDAEAETNYAPNDYGKSTVELDIEEVTSSISQDKEYVITHDVISKQWDNKSKDEFISNPQLITALHQDVKSGVYDKVSPLATKLKLFGDGSKSDIEYYKEAGAQYFAQLDAQQHAERANAEKASKDAKIADVKAKDTKRKGTKKAANKRKAAAPTKSKAGTKDVVDYLDADSMSDDDFSKFMEKEISRK